MTATETRPSESSPYLSGPYAPIQTEITATDCEVEGALPDDLAGAFVRVGANPRFDPPGRYHWFDGDGMVHAVTFADGKAAYRNRYVRTAGLAADEAAGKALRTGILERPDLSSGAPFKDTGNTDVVWHDGKLLALWWLSGAAHRVDPATLDTLGVETFGDTLATNIAAHAKVDPRTGELLFLDYQPFPPYLRFGVVSPDGAVVHQTEVPLDGPRLQHDLAFTDRFAVVFDFSMMWDPEALAEGKVRMAFRRETPTRIGLLGRRDAGTDAHWFEVEPCFMYHTINAWESGDEVVLVGYRIADPLADPSLPQAPQLSHLRLAPDLYEWRLNTATGAVAERVLDSTWGEFGRMHDGLLGRRSTTAWTPRLAEGDKLAFDGLIRHDTTTGEVVDTYTYAPGTHGGEWSFAPRGGATYGDHVSGHGDAVDAETDGYLCTFVTVDGADHGYLEVLDAAAIGEGPVARVKIPQRMPAGYHTRWIPGDDL